MIKDSSNPSSLAQYYFFNKKTTLEKYFVQILFIIAIIICLLFFIIKLPDTYVTKTTIFSTNTPWEISINGKIEKLIKKQGDQVKKGDVLITLHSSAEYSSIIKMISFISKISGTKLYNEPSSILTELSRIKDLSLGEVEEPYQNFLTLLMKYEQKCQLQEKIDKMKYESSSLNLINQRISNLKEQQDVYDSILTAKKETFENSKILFKKGIISKQELKSFEIDYLYNKDPMFQVQNGLIQSEESFIGKKRELELLRDELNYLKVDLLDKFNIFQNKLREWTNTFTIKSPTDGSISYTIPLEEGNKIDNQIIGYIQQPIVKYYGYLYFDQKDINKMSADPKKIQIQVRLDPYPYQKYGIIRAKLTSVSKIATKEGFLAKIELEDHFNTSKNKMNLNKFEGVSGEVLVIFKEISLFKKMTGNNVVL